MEEARRLLDLSDQLVRRVRRAGGLDEQTLRVGFDFAEFGSVPPLPSLLAACRVQSPDANIEIQVLASDQLEQALLDDQLDLAFVFERLSGPKLGFHPLLQGHYQALLPERHPLNQGQMISPVQLASERLLLPKLSAAAGQALLGALSPTGQPPRVVYRGIGVASFAGLVAAGEGIALLPAPLVETALRPGLQARPVDQGPTWSFGLLWKNDRLPAITELRVRTIRQLVPRPVFC